jgi:membrane protease subunit (stomatin/prohibitin family)
MPRKKLHEWSAAREGKTQFCHACGVDRTPAAEKEGCRPTKLF